MRNGIYKKKLDDLLTVCGKNLRTVNPDLVFRLTADHTRRNGSIGTTGVSAWIVNRTFRSSALFAGLIRAARFSPMKIRRCYIPDCCKTRKTALGRFETIRPILTRSQKMSALERKVTVKLR